MNLRLQDISIDVVNHGVNSLLRRTGVDQMLQRRRKTWLIEFRRMLIALRMRTGWKCRYDLCGRWVK